MRSASGATAIETGENETQQGPSWTRTNLGLRWQLKAKRTDTYYGSEGHTNDTMLLAPQAPLYAALFRQACCERQALSFDSHRAAARARFEPA